MIIGVVGCARGSKVGNESFIDLFVVLELTAYHNLFLFFLQIVQAVDGPFHNFIILLFLQSLAKCSGRIALPR